MSIATACRIQSAVRSLHARRSVTIAHEPVSTAMVWLSGVGSGSSSNTRTVVSCVCHGASSVRNQRGRSPCAWRMAVGGVPVWTSSNRLRVSPFLLAPGHVPVKHYAAGKTMGQITNYYGRCACGISPIAYWASALSRWRHIGCRRRCLLRDKNMVQDGARRRSGYHPIPAAVLQDQRHRHLRMLIRGQTGCRRYGRADAPGSFWRYRSGFASG